MCPLANNLNNIWSTRTPETYILRSKLIMLMLDNIQHNFTIYFKKKDGSERTLYCSLSDLTTAGLEIKFSDAIYDNYVNVVGIIEDGIRQVNIETVSYLTIGDSLYKVIDEVVESNYKV